MIKCNEIGETMVLVEALNTYKENNIQDNILGKIPEPGERFKVSKDRLNTLLGNNNHKLVFVKLVEEPKKEEKPKKPIKKKKTK